MNPADNNKIEDILKNTNIETNPDADRVILDELKKELATCQETEPDRCYHWSKIMNNNYVKIAAAAVILIALSVFFVMPNGGTTIALADAMNPLLNAKNAALDIVIGQGDNETVIYDQIKGQKIYRKVLGVTSAEMVLDLDKMEMMTISPEEKTVTYIKLDGLGNIKNYLTHLQTLAQKLIDSKYFQVDALGYQEYKGVEYYVYEANVPEAPQKNVISIWINPETMMPSRIIEETENMKITCENIEFDIDMDEALFSQEVPEGYTEHETTIDFSANNEDNFIETLRISSEIINNGYFPDDVSIEGMVQLAKDKMSDAFKEQGYSQEEILDLSTQWGQGLVFIRMYKGQGKWYYNGKGVELGDAETPVFWWHPQDTEKWRVIYGDLTVEECLEEELPEVTNN